MFIANGNLLIKLDSNLNVLNSTRIVKNVTIDDHAVDVIKVFLIYGEKVVACTILEGQCFMRDAEDISLPGENESTIDFISRNQSKFT